MRRREFITLAGALAIAVWPLELRAQRPDRVRRVGVLTDLVDSDRDAQSWISTLRQQLDRSGWSDGRNLRVEVRWGAGDLARLAGYADELVSLTPDVLFGDSTPAIAALQKATRTIPIVFVGGSNPVGSGFVASLARPGGNITGFISFEPNMGGKWLETLKELAPGILRVGLIYNPQTHTGQYFDSIERAAQVLAVQLIRLPFDNATEIERGLDDLARAPNSGLLVLSDPSTGLHRDLIIASVARHRLPAIYPFRWFVTSGGLASYGVDRRDQYQRAAEYVSRILKGEKPADLPVQAPIKFELLINVKTAKTLGLTIPPSILLRADETLE
jgi:putative ABC transport system substrate-binding protein